MRVDYIVVRHKQAGIPSLIAKNTRASVINAGDGWHAHPTQALLDAFTLQEIYKDLRGCRALIVGDIQHSAWPAAPASSSAASACRWPTWPLAR
jgi:aspartate carbamoyltransferase catalytic subunit